MKGEREKEEVREGEIESSFFLVAKVATTTKNGQEHPFNISKIVKTCSVDHVGVRRGLYFRSISNGTFLFVAGYGLPVVNSSFRLWFFH